MVVKRDSTSAKLGLIGVYIPLHEMALPPFTIKIQALLLCVVCNRWRRDLCLIGEHVNGSVLHHQDSKERAPFSITLYVRVSFGVNSNRLKRMS